uniref:NADH-ubiquinone oxidoreductase chain 3 n=1 Tax=Ornithodoros sonrai TaxID=352064 RepID=A0A3G2JZZ6_9ACAR|nr:NADH dehydrogenase subunit 3 [Ornithodoros sonrai]AYN50617.1 NADH dehydrogenase subunit 3 [Ornithodoros sonrai]
MKFLMTSFLISSFIILMGSFFKKKNFLKKEKNSPFECGFDPFSLTRSTFSLRFFMISIIFIIFDIEIIMILPFPIMMETTNFSTLMFMMITITVIFTGLIYEWKNGMIEWLK